MRSGRPLTSLAAVGILILANGCGVSAPSVVETRVITAIKHDLTVGGKKDKNPFPMTDEFIQLGKRNFTGYCSNCHGNDGHATDVAYAARMKPPVPDLGSDAVQSYSDGQLKWIIENGVAPSGMPASKGFFTDDQIWQMVVFLRSVKNPSTKP